MRVFVTGDVHNRKDRVSRIVNFADDKELKKDDIILIAGDAGFIFNPDFRRHYERLEAEIAGDSKISDTDVNLIHMFASSAWGKNDSYEKEQLARLGKMKCQIAYVPGNHENYDRIEKLDDVDFYGGRAKKIQDNLFVLGTPEVYDFGGRLILTYGGATSIDKDTLPRYERFSWWKQEKPSNRKPTEAVIKAAGRKMDVLLTHQMPRRLFGKITPKDPDSGRELKISDVYCPVADHVEKLVESIRFDRHIFGHWHQDVDFEGGFSCVYDRFLEV